MNIDTRVCEICPPGHSCKRGTVTPTICGKGEYAAAGSADSPDRSQRTVLACPVAWDPGCSDRKRPGW